MDEKWKKRKLPSHEMDIPIQSKREFRASFKSTTTHTKKVAGTFEPRGINVLEFAEARAMEIKNLQTALDEAKRGCNSTAIQRLPRHMRRRAGNHDIKRLPKRLRPNKGAVQDNKKSKKQNKSKKNNRRQRRKPKSLFEEYKKRQEGYKWLETHIWHAKRFYMKEKWGYKVADKTFAKAVRSSYRSVKDSCMLQDLSYFEVIQLVGNPNDILECMKHICPESSDVNEFMDSRRYLNLICYKLGCYPFNAIGPVRILWANDVIDEKRKLIVISHPSISDDVIEQIDLYNSQKEGHISSHRYKLDFVILGVTGKQSSTMLANMLKQHGADHGELLKRCLVACKPNNVLNLAVKDPRYFIPKKKKNPLDESEVPSSTEVEENVFTDQQLAEYSDVWDEKKRTTCSESKISDAEINKMREALLCQVEELPAESPEIPVCLMRLPGLELSRGFQMILPSNWAMPFWISLIYQGARAGGLQEEINVCFETGSLHFPISYPDTKSGLNEDTLKANVNEEKYKRIPPAKRISYNHLGIRYPHRFPWLDLVLQWRFNLSQLLQETYSFIKQNNDQFYVLRNKHRLLEFSRFLNDSSSSFDISRFENALIPLKIQATRDGIPEDNALLCIPESTDHRELEESKEDQFSEYRGPIEPQHKGLKENFPFVSKRHNLNLYNVQLIGRCTRWIVGFVTKGNFSLVSGKGSGVGFVSALALYYHLRTVGTEFPRDRLLFRNTNTLHYRYCKIDLIGC